MRVSIARDITVTPMEAGAVVLDGRRGRYWQLNGTGAVVIRVLLEGKAPADAARRLSENGAVTAEQAMADVLSLIDALTEAKLVEVTP